MRRAWVVIVVFVATACGSSGSKSSTAPVTVTSVSPSTTTATSVPTTTTTVAHDDANTVTKFCAYTHDMTAALNSQPTQFNNPAYNKQVDTTALQAVKHAATIAPVALRPKFALAVAFYQKQYDDLAAVGFDGSKVDAAKEQPTPAQRAAISAIGQFVIGVCHVNGNTTG